MEPAHLRANPKDGESGFGTYSLGRLVQWAQMSSISYLTLDLACCGIEMLQTEGSRYDIERFGSLVKVSPRHADLLIVAGNITYKTAPILKHVYDEMPEQKYVIALGGCAISGGLFAEDISYSCLSGADKVVPVDVYIPGCPPRPEAVLQGVLELQKKVLSL